MNLIDSMVFKQNMSVLSNWVDSTPVNQMIDSVTYDLYESNNPFRKKFDKTHINNKGLRVVANATTTVSAEVFSAFANPYYLTHKFTQIPIWCDSVVDVYKNTVQNNK